MKALLTLFALAAIITASHAQSPRQPLPSTGMGTGTSLPFPGIGTRVPVVFTPVQQPVAPDYQQLVATGDYYFNQKKYGDAIDQYDKALAQRQEQYPKDQILRAKALQAREEKDQALRTEEEKKADAARIPPSEFIPRTLTDNNWRNTALVCDVTGSMDTYNEQVLAWLKSHMEANDSAVRRIVLFNDGDGRKDNTKVIGATGGLYSFVPTTFVQAEDEVRFASKAGTGGDYPENNVEALLKAQADCPSCESLIMIADNSSPRDISLASQVLKPVHILICGKSGALETAYINLARMTKGSVHFNGKTYTGLDAYAEGAMLKVDNTTYTVQKGAFVRTN